MAGRGVGIADVFASKALGGQILKEARSTLLNELRGNLSPDAHGLGTTGDRGTRGPGMSKAKLKAADQLRREPKVATPMTARRGLPLPDYPWATPERQGPGFTDPPKTGWQHTVSPPWIFAKDAGRVLATDVHGQVKPNWKGRRGPKEGDEPPWFQEDVPQLARHERVSSIMQQMPGLSPETRDARMTLCTPDATNAMNLRARGGQHWKEYLSGSDNPIFRGTQTHLLALCHIVMFRILRAELLASPRGRQTPIMFDEQ